ncbi:MAG: hypothetical protein J0I14_09800 [Propionibacteriaceae bacterium]|nr:hypothetical protein [Propionibacteriaceae bacterium]
MNAEEIDRILGERAQARVAGEDAELRSIHSAIFIEDAFGVTLSDEQLASGLLDDPAALRAFLSQSNQFD